VSAILVLDTSLNLSLQHLGCIFLNNFDARKFSRNSFQRLCSASPVSQFKRVTVIHRRTPSTEATGSEEHDSE
jgi:hypothetical protein